MFGSWPYQLEHCPTQLPGSNWYILDSALFYLAVVKSLASLCCYGVNAL